jgi:hypothetical protein
MPIWKSLIFSAYPKQKNTRYTKSNSLVGKLDKNGKPNVPEICGWHRTAVVYVNLKQVHNHVTPF